MMPSLDVARVSVGAVTLDASGIKASGVSWISAGDAAGLIAMLSDSCSKTSGILPSLGAKDGERGVPG